ncbi:MAG: hypothetical protein FJX72_08735 [Armatimonadetes bacterium]|nr:hypothetical protein [Armatimonadota bacterium]
MLHHSLLVVLLIAVGVFGAVSCAASATDPLPGVPWPATDALGRSAPLSDEVGAPRKDRWVGIFYFLWHDNPGGRNPNGDGPYDICKILEADPDAAKKPESPLWGPVGMYHYWGEPLYGYYRSDDPWVLRRHAHLLADAGVDTLIFDTTNAVTYTPVFLKLCEVFAQVRAEGGSTPQICFMVNTQAGATARRIYEDLYKKGLYSDLWFRWEGKPLIICDPKEADDELKGFFTLRRAHWPFEMINTPYAWHWEATYPQPYGYTTDPSKAEMVNVSVAQNLRVADGRVTNMSSGDARGRSFRDGKMDLSPGSVNFGHNFEEQWKRVRELDPPFVMITGWNEWIAGRWGDPKGPLVFVDQFDQQHSRDIEPGRCSHGDNYYWQMIAGVRRYKGAAPIPTASASKTVRIEGGFDQWADVGPEFAAHVGGAQPRDHDGTAGTHYVNGTGRNDIVACKVVRDAENVYFHVRTNDPLSSWAGPNWMWLLIRVADPAGLPNWNGYRFIVNREMDGPDRTWLEVCEGGWKWKKAARVTCRTGSHEMHLAIPRKALGLGDGPIALEFQWIDNAQQPGDALDVYVSGDAAPSGRFRYRYSAP